MPENFAAQGLTAGNKILDRLPEATIERLRPHLQEVNLHQHQTLYDMGERVRDAYFPAGAVVAGVLLTSDGTVIETCMIGGEGVVGLNAALGEQRSNNWMRVLLPGRALRLGGEVLSAVFDGDADLRRLLLLYYRTRANHVAHRAVCNSRHPLAKRLCTWLLMLHDRGGGGEIPLTQEAVARQMGVRRAGVNECVGELQKARAVEHSRGHIRVRDRELLERAACSCYRAFRRELDWCDEYPDAPRRERPAAGPHPDGFRR